MHIHIGIYLRGQSSLVSFHGANDDEVFVLSLYLSLSLYNAAGEIRLVIASVCVVVVFFFFFLRMLSSVISQSSSAGSSFGSRARALFADRLLL